MSSTAVIVSEVLISLISYILIWAKNKGLSDEECNSLIKEAIEKVRQTKPENLPDV